MNLRKCINNFTANLRIINFIRRIVVKLIVIIDKKTNSNKKNSVYDKKTILEIFKHYLNFYESYLPRIYKLNKYKPLYITEIYSINKEIGNSIFLIDIKKFSGYEGSYYFDDHSPLTKTAIQLINNKNLKIEDSYLFDFFKKFQPKKYGDLYNLSAKNKLFNLSSNTIFMPWLHEVPISGFHSGVFGPKHKSAIKHRILRLKNIIHNINLYGYIPTEDDSIEGYIAILDRDYRFVITSGHHRVAVLKAINHLNSKKYNLVSVKYDLKRVKYRNVNNKEIEIWPGIKSGYIDSKDSLELYENYFI